MNCPFCAAKAGVIDTRQLANGNRSRTRLCATGHRFYTIEYWIDRAGNMLGPEPVKRSGREPGWRAAEERR